MEYNKRRNILQVGSLKFESRPFKIRGMEVVKVDIKNVRDGLNEACAIIVAEQADKMGFIREAFKSLKPLAENYGLSFVAIAESNTHWKLLQQYWKELKIGDPENIYTLDLDAIEIAAENIRNYDPGPPLGKPKILNLDTPLSRHMRHILRRAFCDCDRIYLEPLGGGKASLGVFCVHAWLKKSVVGPRPLPFFIKIDESQRIEAELANYHYYAEFYIPFYLRPNLDQERCVKIKRLSAIVGNFVEDARPLRNALRSNEAPGVLFSLFENSLKGFRAQPSDKNTDEWSLEDFVTDRARTKEISKEVIRCAQKLGLKLLPADIESLLIKKIKGVKQHFRPYHGDLHSGNIMVRGKDAILIDFSSVQNGPLAADPAALEVSLVFSIDDNDRLKQFGEWKKFVNEIYKGNPTHQLPSAEKKPGSFSWLRKAIREIRHVLLGCDYKQKETTAILATYLIRFARLPLEDCKNSLKRLDLLHHAYALVVAERIVKSLK